LICHRHFAAVAAKLKRNLFKRILSYQVKSESKVSGDLKKLKEMFVTEKKSASRFSKKGIENHEKQRYTQHYGRGVVKKE
jgi:hypothetical protein